MIFPSSRPLQPDVWPSCTEDTLVTRSFHPYAFAAPRDSTPMHRSSPSVRDIASQQTPFPPSPPPTSLSPRATVSPPSAAPAPPLAARPAPTPRIPRSAHQRPIPREGRAALFQAVYVVRCAHCDTFFTDRGMKAALLLKLHVTLFSTDAMPSNCSPVYGPEEVLGDSPDASALPKERTCNCLTQTLGCQVCGATVGYNVVTPCARCSSNISKHSWGHNGHRIVFHCADISAHERRYIPGDRGVKCMDMPSGLTALFHEQTQIEERLRYLVQKTYPDESDPGTVMHDADYDHDNSDDDTLCEQQQVQSRAKDPTWSMIRNQEFRLLEERNLMIQQVKRNIYAQLLKQYQEGARMLLQGETVYWSDLVERGGERTQPFDPEPLLAVPLAGR